MRLRSVNRGDLVELYGGGLFRVKSKPSPGVLRVHMYGRPLVVRTVKARDVAGHWRKAAA